ncbi:MAG: TonB-dependent receptor [Candidatus Methylopumilus sp.]|jgi:hemoglobin/transferrin/lactoferrin receptor protein
MKPQDKISLIAISLGWLAILLMVGPKSAQSAETSSADNPQSMQKPAQDTSKQGNPKANASEAQKEMASILPEVSVNAASIKDTSIDPTQSITTITAKDLERTQPATIFDAIRDVPGVGVSGGPRPSGMTFNVRGYTDNEDVAVKVDGVSKGFEKYRMGGTFIEPELLKSIEVQRGPQITSGAGSLGGTIIATTKDAADLLKPGQKYGARAKFGYANNNDEYSRSYMVYGRPHERIDILYNYSNRQSNDITLANGSKLSTSAIQSISKLLKVSLFPTDNLQLTTSIVSFQDSGLQPYDATGSGPASFGYVIRSIDDLTWSESLHFTPDNRWIDLKAIYGRGHTNLSDRIPPQQNPGSPNNQSNPLCNGPLLNGNPINFACRGNITDAYEYETASADVSNKVRIYEGDYFKANLLTGYQYAQSERHVTRVSENPTYNKLFYPDGFNAAAPPGTKTTHAVYLQPRFVLGALSITPGVRWDKVTVEAAGGTEKILQQNNEATKVEFNQRTYSLGLAYDIISKRLTLFSNYGQGFRPPLLDEYFSQGGFGSRCTAYNMPSGPASGICGGLYKPQLSESTEAGISYQNPHLFNSAAQLTSKFTFFHIHTSRLLYSLGETTDGEIVQRGKETRNGIEFENTMSYGVVYGRMAYSRTAGGTSTDLRTKPDPTVFPPPDELLYTRQGSFPLYTVPGNALSVTLGADISSTLNINVGYRKVSSRTVVLSGDIADGSLVFGKQDGYELFNAGIHYRPTPNLGLRLIGENLANKQYNLDGGFGGSIGLPAPGRNLRFVAELTY